MIVNKGINHVGVLTGKNKEKNLYLYLDTPIIAVSYTHLTLPTTPYV